MKREEKEREIEGLANRLEKAKTLIFAGFRGLKVSELNELRARLKQSNSSLKVVKNRLMKRVLTDRGLDALSNYFTGPTALASSDTEPVSPAKVLVEFAKAHENLTLKGGFLDGRVLAQADVIAISKMPSREELLARAFASMLAPASNMASVLAAVSRGLLYAINAIKEKKQ